MARKVMVTRTVTTTEATVLCLNTETCEPFNETVVLSKSTTDTKVALKEAKKQLENDTISVAKVVSLQPLEKMYGLELTDFIKYATELDPATRKLLETENAEELETSEPAEA